MHSWRSEAAASGTSEAWRLTRKNFKLAYTTDVQRFAESDLAPGGPETPPLYVGQLIQRKGLPSL